MAKSILAAVHDAVAGAVEDIPERGATGAQAPNSTKEGETMSTDNAPAGGDKNTGISRADHDAAVNAARTEGEAAGAKAATDRLGAALGADGVKGDAGRMAAALELAQKSPGMSGEDVASFVVANVGASATTDAQGGYEASRLAAAGQAHPAPRTAKKATIDTNGIYARRAKQEG